MCICVVSLMGVLCVNSRSTKMKDKEVGLCDTALHTTDTRNQTDEVLKGDQLNLLQRRSLLKYRT